MSSGRLRFRHSPRVLTVLFGLLFALLSGYTVVASWQQARLVREVAVAGSNTDAYQQAAFLVTSEMGLIQAAMREPDGEERFQVRTVNQQADDALVRMAAVDQEHGSAAAALAQQHRGLQPVVYGLLAQLDRGDTGAAFTTLEVLVEPVYQAMTASLLGEQKQHLVEYGREQAGAQQDADRSVLVVLVVFLFGLVVLAGFGLSSRSHRRRVETMAATDALTGLPNRTAFAAYAEHAVATGKLPAVLIVNIDGFRDVNDQLGQRIGDLLLIEAGRRLGAVVRRDDLVARLGGDEFAVLSTGTDPGGPETIAVRVVEELQRPFSIDDVVVDLEVSVGAAAAEPGEDMLTVLRNADSAMHIAKRNRSSFHQFSRERSHDVAARLSLLGDLRRALDDTGQIALHYQPKIAVDTGTLVGVEALARWTHPTRGAISPGEFIPVLETTSLMKRFTEHVLATALAQARAWHDAGHRFPIAVNISARSLLDPGFPDHVASLLAAAGVDGAQLCVEVTEYALMDDPDTAIEALHRIRRLGVKASIDDYGTGYSSMTYLKMLPVDELKIDRSFVGDIAGNDSSRALVASTVELGHSLGLTVVAEGVEDAGAVDALRVIGCDIAQGYHFAKPMTAAALTERLADSQGLPDQLKGTEPAVS